jgi:hypothetical protein
LPATFEGGFGDVERTAENAAKTATGTVAAARKLRAAAASGDIGELRRWGTRLCDLAEALRQESLNALGAWPFSVEEETKYLQEKYVAELADAARTVGTRLVVAADDRLLAFPLVVRVAANDRSIRLGKSRITALRPTRVVTLIRAAQAKPGRFVAERFLETLYRTYSLVAGGERVTMVALARIYEALTLLPGSDREYQASDFARDIYLLDRAAVTRTRDGVRLAFHASTGTKDNRDVFSLITPEGETKTYFAISFTRAEQ